MCPRMIIFPYSGVMMRELLFTSIGLVYHNSGDNGSINEVMALWYEQCIGSSNGYQY